MWIKYLIIFFLFYIFAVLQNSFFVHFSLFGAAPNLVFVLFFLLVFFSRQGRDPAAAGEIIFSAITAGLFLDFFSYTYFGVSIVLLLLIGFFVKKIQSVLSEKRNNKFPLIYFLPLFFVSLLVYDLLLRLFLDKFSFTSIMSDFNAAFISEIVYNLLLVSAAFYVYKKFLQPDVDDRQLPLFNR